MTTVVVSVPKVVDNPDVGGHFWVFMQYVDGLRRLGCDVWWLERISLTPAGTDGASADERITRFIARTYGFGLADRLILYTGEGLRNERAQLRGLLTMTPAAFDALTRRADLLLNFDYMIDPDVPASFARSALVDIDPGLLQFWVHHHQVPLASHDVYFTTGETVGTPRARFPNCGQWWVPIHPCVSLELWPFAPDPTTTTFTTVSSWWGSGGNGGEWVFDGVSSYDNNKRASFLQFIDVPSHAPTPIELALALGPGDEADVDLLRSAGWRISSSSAATGTPDGYRSFVYRSRGEFSCTKPSCLRFKNAWISDRTLCYLASGRPAVVQDTGASTRLPSGEGLFRFSTLDEAVDALATVEADYNRHSRAARELAESAFDAKATAAAILNYALSSPSRDLTLSCSTAAPD